MKNNGREKIAEEGYKIFKARYVPKRVGNEIKEIAENVMGDGR